ncbi:MAG: type II toxin-antitoxin system VapC family toxin [Moorea sp. SIO2B7]|nr:type II toxin-antitoxin system VapC family toxin [Moorena sp. SIO2B7]
MVTEFKRIYLDTNILAYVANTKAPHHKVALEIFRPSEKERLCVSSQVMAEFYSYLTNPTILVSPLTSQKALYRIKRICQMSHVDILSTPLNLFQEWMNLLEQYPITNGQIFDLLHIAIMLSHGIKTIYTFNAKDFVWCSEIEVIDPSQ